MPAALQYLGIDFPFTDPETATVAIVPCPYEGSVSYGTGTAAAPAAIIEASQYLELYDEVLDGEPYRAGIITLDTPELPNDAAGVQKVLYEQVRSQLNDDRFVVTLGGDHSVSAAPIRAYSERYPDLTVIQLDAHADLRDEYEDSPLSHACIMSRVLEMGCQTFQFGIRSLSVEEAQRIRDENLNVYFMHECRSPGFDVKAIIQSIKGPVYLTVDVDVFDWSVVRSTGTPEPGGFLWDEAIGILKAIIENTNVVGFDVVELSAPSDDPNSPFAVAKLIYKMLGIFISGRKSSAH
jgi:agmatinase